jgi:hypothetical protein
MARDSKSDEFAKSERGLAERLGLGQGVEFAARLEMSMDAALTFLVENDGRDQWSLPHEITIEDHELRVVIEWRFWGDEYWPYDDGALAGEECPCYARFDVIPLGPGACDVRAQWVKPTSDPFYPLFERDMRRLWELGGKEWPGKENPSSGSTPATSRGPTPETDSEGLTKPKMPEHPKEDSEEDSPERRDRWLRYYQECRDAGIQYTLKDLAEALNLSEGHIKRLRREWKRRHREDDTK